MGIFTYSRFTSAIIVRNVNCRKSFAMVVPRLVPLVISSPTVFRSTQVKLLLDQLKEIDDWILESSITEITTQHLLS